jgi:hypothetical protein
MHINIYNDMTFLPWFCEFVCVGGEDDDRHQRDEGLEGMEERKEWKDGRNGG